MLGINPQQRSSQVDDRSHELPSSECRNVARRWFEPFPVFATIFKARVPVGFDPCGIVGFDRVNGDSTFGQLDRKLALATADRICATDCIVATGFQKVYETKRFKCTASGALFEDIGAQIVVTSS